MDVDDDETEKAMANISAQLKSFTSPLVGTMLQPTPTSHHTNINRNNPYSMDATEWMEQELSPPPATTTRRMMLPPSSSPTTTTTRSRTVTATSSSSATTSTPKRTPLLERADTPVMSNSSSSHQKLHPKQRKTNKDEEYDDDDESMRNRMMEPVQTPAAVKMSRSRMLSSPPRAWNTPTATSTTTSTLGYRRYHDALWNYLKAKRSLSHRMDLEQQEQQLLQVEVEGNNAHDDATTTTAAVSSSSSLWLSTHEQKSEMDFLKSLSSNHRRPYSSENNNNKAEEEESNVWRLLYQLRPLGLSALIWNNDTISAGQNASAQTVYLQQLSAKGNDTTPQELVQELRNNNSSDDSTNNNVTTPLVLQRRYQILEWMQSCQTTRAATLMEKVGVPRNQQSSLASTTTTTTTTSVSHPDAAPTLVQEPQQQQRQQQLFLQACLAQIMAGRLDQAQALCRSHGQSWRAATLAGGQPAGYQKVPNESTQRLDSIRVGNPQYFLWKRQVWANGRRNSASPEEAAIYALLGNDILTCLANPCLRTFSQALYCVWKSVWDRIEDELLHWHNNHLRRANATNNNTMIAGTEYLQQETQHLLATSGLAGMTETQIIQLLWSSPFPAIRGTGTYESAMVAFLIGKSAILEYCDMETTSGYGEEQGDMERLRFLTHLMLYLDSLSASTTPVHLEGLTIQKNRMLFAYVQHLERRPDLWNMLALYVSLLPEEQLLEYYPTVLVKVLEATERTAMLEQMRELFPQLEIHVLRQVVRLALANNNNDDDDDDETKSQSIQWLLQNEDHYGDALICSNILLRDFFLNLEEDKMETAMLFVEEHLPEDLIERAGQTPPAFDSLPQEVYDRRVDNARSEHLAFLSYLDAYRTFGKWKDVLVATSPTTTANALGAAAIDWTRLNSNESKIAQQRMVKDWIRQKKQSFQTVLDAADQARKVLTNVLQHPGGWLSTDNDDVDDNNTAEHKTRLRDIAEIRSRYLVLAVNLYLQVCEDTASWFSRSLDDASLVGLTRVQALEHLDIPKAAPAFWYQKALDLAILVASDTHGIHKAFGSLELSEFLTKLAETAVSKLMNA